MKKNKNIEAKASKVIETATSNAEVINQEVAQAIATENATEVKNNAKESAEAPTPKNEKKDKKAKKVKAIKEAEVKAESKKDKKKKKANKEAEATVKEVAKQQKAALVEKVIANREVKYIYPEDVVDTLSRKTWRQKTRNKLHQLELAVSRIKDQNSKEYKKALKEYNDFRKEVLKPEQVA